MCDTGLYSVLISTIFYQIKTFNIVVCTIYFMFILIPLMITVYNIHKCKLDKILLLILSYIIIALALYNLDGIAGIATSGYLIMVISYWIKGEK